MTTTEQPTFFGPAESPLFGVLHLPADRRVSEGVVLCASLGKESADSVRFQRILADELASRGVAVLRFDYLGTGDSACEQQRDGAAEDWIASVGHGVEYLRSIGVESVSGVAHRAGCLILEAAMHRHGLAFDRLVYIDAPLSGRRYLRELSSLFKLAVGTGVVAEGTTPMVGLALSEQAAKEFGTLTLDAAMADAPAERLFVVRPDTEEKLAKVFSGTARTPSVKVAQMNSSLSLPMPLQTLDEIVSWLERRTPTTVRPVTPRIEVSAEMPAQDAHCPAVRETIETFGPKGLFAIRSAPVTPVARGARAVLFCATSVDPHIGPAREWVELSRRVAGAGHVALRWDREGLGNSTGLRRRQWYQIYRRSEIADVVAAARHADPVAANVCAVGVCSGAWYASHAAHRGGAEHLVMINPILWSWSARSSWATELVARLRFAKVDESPISLTGQPSTPRLAQRAARVRSRIRHSYHRHAPRLVRRVVCALGIGRAPESVLTRLAKSGVDTTVILGPEDWDTFTEQQGQESVQRLSADRGRPFVMAVAQGDHGAYHPALLAATRDAVDAVLVGAPADGADTLLRSAFDPDAFIDRSRHSVPAAGGAGGQAAVPN